jgi:hypothetical protein
MIWPAAALAVFLLGFLVLYGSVLQSRVDAETAQTVDERA